ncbi:heparinase II/III-family protein [Terriglobus albidus]|uniref:heparinase II/III-family protein n=1 Tax=Terriglobus albidus TaxID=1592106 RepID=UPI0021E07EBF|nr:heparinase II/III-family protein [Terriglobus albidus]
MRLNFRAWLVLSFFCLVIGTAAAQQDRSPLAPYVYRSHFQPSSGVAPGSGSRDGWESFPLAEDTGYDPTLGVETSHGLSAVTREVVPHRDGKLAMGFIRRMYVVAGPSSSLAFRLRVSSATGGIPVSIHIYRGEEEVVLRSAIQGGGWQHVQVALPASSRRITAIAITADLPHVSSERLERVALSDVELRAQSTRHYLLKAPTALWDGVQELFYLPHALRPGDQLAVEFDGPKPSFHASWEIEGPDGQLIDHGSGLKVQHAISPSDPDGVWTLRLVGQGGFSTVLALIRPSIRQPLLGAAVHAVSPELLQQVVARRDELRKDLGPALAFGVGTNIPEMNAQLLLPGLSSYFNLVQKPTELALWDAVSYRTTGESRERDEALHILREIASWPQWVHPWFPAHGYLSYYPLGIMTKNIVMAEQFLGNALPADLKHTLDDALLQQSIKPVYQEYVVEDRLQFDTSNWIGHTVGGALLAALQSDDPDIAGYVLALYAKERRHLESAYTADDSYGEGISYHRFDFETTALVAAAAKEQLGKSFDSRLARPQRYLRYATYGKDSLEDFGDSHGDTGPSNVFAYMAAQNSDPDLTAFYFQYRNPGTTELLSRVLWEDGIHQSAATTAVDAPTSALFEKRGVAALRDSWSPESAVIAMRAGPNFNHNHADQGSLYYAWNNRLWIGEAGYADYYKDPNYRTYNIQAIGHNTILVDGDPESQVVAGNAVFGKYPSMRRLASKDGSEIISADLSSVYPQVRSYVRTLIYRKGGTLVVMDQIRADGPHRFSQIWHPEQAVESFDLQKNLLRMRAQNDSVEMHLFSTTAMILGQSKGPFPLSSYEKAEREPVQKPMIIEYQSGLVDSLTILTLIQPSGGAIAPQWSVAAGAKRALRLGDLLIQCDNRQATVSFGKTPDMTWTIGPPSQK